MIKNLQKLLDDNKSIDWETSQKIIPEDEIPFLKSEQISKYASLAGFSKDAIDYLQSTAKYIASHENLKCLAWHFHYLLCFSKSYERSNASLWPDMTDIMGNTAGAYYLLIILSVLPGAVKFHESRGIPEKVKVDTYSDTLIWAQNYYEKHGYWGVSVRLLPWLLNHLHGDLFRLCRLQFMQRPFRSQLYAFRSKKTGHVKVLSASGIKYRSDGQLDGTGEVFDPENGWTSAFSMEYNYALGNPIHPAGYALSEKIQLPLNNWQLILSPGDPILEIHIPAGQRMDFNECGESFKQALDFFPRYFPERPFKAFCCGSWLLNTQYQEMLPTDSNIVRFQKEFYLYPIFSGGRSGIERIFRNEIRDFSKAPRDTTLRRVVADHIQSGGYLRAGGALLFPEDLDWGKQVYIKSRFIR